MPSARIDALAFDAITARIFPGAVVYAQHAGRVTHYAAYGTTMYGDPGSQPVVPTTIYDLASLTKLFTATAALILYDTGLIRLDDPVARFLPGLRAREITVRHLLTHSSGLDLRLSTLRDSSADAIRATAYALMPAHPPGTMTMYTNIGSMLLGDVVAAAFGSPLDSVMGEVILGPLGMAETCFRPPAQLQSRIAPSEIDLEWRGSIVHGVVHDESAYALGGVTGHAGLFSTAADMARFATLWLQDGAWGGQQILREATVALAIRDHTGHMDTTIGKPLHSGLGWMRDRSSFMGAAPPGSIGHTGFTGPVLVLLPATHAALVILSNRTYPRRTPPPYPHHTVTAAMVKELLAY
ncbi:MAG: serine hydrolase domain-containing protein [Chloroflexales bacterium]